MTERLPVMVVLDDDEEIAEVIGAIGEQAGFEVAITDGPGPFQEVVRSRDPDVIVLDLQMPDMDGIQALRVLSENSVRAGILIVSGMDERTLVAAERYATHAGLELLGSLQKPFMPEVLRQRLQVARSATGALTGADLKKAIDEEQLVVHFQPVVRRFADGTWDVAAFEALARWDHPSRGLLAPDAFLDIGEEAGVVNEITDYVIQRGVEQLRGWDARRLNLGLRINVAATSLGDIDFPDRLDMLVSEQEVDPSALTLEISEAAMLQEHAETFDILTRLRVKGLNLAIDDFGVGYSSLTKLFQMPFNEMKIDRSLIHAVPQSKEARIMVEMLVELAHKLDLTACAEGVETEDAFAFLDSVFCDSVQGYLIGRPVPADDVPAVMDRWAHRSAQQETSVGSAG